MLVICSKKQTMMQKISYIESKYFTVSGYNKFMSNMINNKITDNQLVKKFDITGFIDNTNIDKKIGTITAKGELKAEQGKTVKLQAFD